MFLYSVTFFFFKQKTAYEMRISDWSSDVCSSDLSSAAVARRCREHAEAPPKRRTRRRNRKAPALRASAQWLSLREHRPPHQPSSVPDRKSTRLNSSH